MFREDLLVCPRCDGRAEVIAAVTDPNVTRLRLAHLGLAADPVRVACARAPPQADLWPDGLADDYHHHHEPA